MVSESRTYKIPVRVVLETNVLVKAENRSEAKQNAMDKARKELNAIQATSWFSWGASLRAVESIE